MTAHPTFRALRVLLTTLPYRGGSSEVIRDHAGTAMSSNFCAARSKNSMQIKFQMILTHAQLRHGLLPVQHGLLVGQERGRTLQLAAVTTTGANGPDGRQADDRPRHIR